MTGAHISDPALNRVVLFSAAADGSPPVGALTYSYRPTVRTEHILFDLTPSTRYRRTLTQNGSTQMVTLTPDVNGTYQASPQGVLHFVLQLDGEPEPENPVASYLPLIMDK